MIDIVLVGIAIASWFWLQSIGWGWITAGVVVFIAF